MITITNYHDGKEKTAPSESFYCLTVIIVIIYGKCLNAVRLEINIVAMVLRSK